MSELSALGEELLNQIELLNDRAFPLVTREELMELEAQAVASLLDDLAATFPRHLTLCLRRPCDCGKTAVDVFIARHRPQDRAAAEALQRAVG